MATRQLLNPNLDRAKLAQDFRQTGMIVIDQIMKPEEAEKIHTFLKNMPDEVDKPWWNWARWTQDSGARLIYTKPAFKADADAARQQAYIRRSQGKYSYSFKRTAEDHFDRCNCQLCLFKAWLAGPEFMTFIEEITGFQYDLINLFANKYQAGDYLDRHTDKVGPRSLTYVFNMTKNWREEYGGLLLMIEQGRYYAPGFNKLVLFDLPPGGRLHCVTEVAQNVTEVRLGLTGWYQNKQFPGKPEASDTDEENTIDYEPDEDESDESISDTDEVEKY